MNQDSARVGGASEDDDIAFGERYNSGRCGGGDKTGRGKDMPGEAMVITIGLVTTGLAVPSLQST